MSVDRNRRGLYGRQTRPLGGGDPSRYRAQRGNWGRASKRCAASHRGDRLAPPGEEHKQQLIIGAPPSASYGNQTDARPT